MASSNLVSFLFVFFIFVVISPTIQADIVGTFQDLYDDAKGGVSNLFNGLKDDVHDEVSEKFNDAIDDVKSVFNGTRRILARKTLYKGPCKATNPIDQCWRCDINWASNRQRLADCAMGFGKDSIGGKGGRYYVVTDSSDDNVEEPKPGTLRWGVIQPEPLWIIFGASMVIRLKQELIVQSFKTIDGRGHKVRIKGGAGITIQSMSNIIIHSLYIHNIVSTNGGTIRDSITHKGLRTRADGDGISIWGSRNIWLDHLSMSKASDGLIDVIQGSTNITISNCHFTDHNKVLLFGANEHFMLDKDMKITVAYTHFGKRLIQRMPRCRFGFFNLVNNDYTHWEMYAIGGSEGATILSEGNRFIAQKNNPKTREVTYRVNKEDNWRSWTWVSVDDEFKRGAFFTTSGNQHPDLTHFQYGLIPHAPAHMVKEMCMFSGALGRCVERRPC